ncbi:MAG: FkbM family methyltransferase [Candidatus Acidiferrum sp.]
MNAHSKLRQFLRVYPAWRFAPPSVQLQRGTERFGSDYGGYCLDPSLVRRDSIVYSVGIGEDISFDLSLIARFGVNIEAFDPTPRVGAWLATQSLPPQFHFHPAGIAGHDGAETFYLPSCTDWVSHSVVYARQFARETVRLPVMRLSTAMQLQNHDRIDVLKMDIEGAEYAVIEEVVREKIPVTQLLLEFHHRLSSLGTGKTKRALSLLNARGMKISSVCPRKEIFTLVQSV